MSSDNEADIDPTEAIGATMNNPTAEAPVAFRFCADCSNMLYPKEDRANSQLMFVCRTCHWSDKGSESCIWRNRLVVEDTATAGVTQDIGSDPTVSPPVCGLLALQEEGGQSPFCLVCGNLLLEGETSNENTQEEEKSKKIVIDVAMMDAWDAEDMGEDEEEGEDYHQSKL